MQQNNRVIATSAVGIITEALRQIVPDVGLRVRRTFAYDEHKMTPLEFVRSLMTFSSGVQCLHDPRCGISACSYGYRICSHDTG